MYIIVICNQYWSHTEQIKHNQTSEPIRGLICTWFQQCLSKQKCIPGSVNFNFYICQMAYARKFKSFSYYNRHTFYQPIITIIVIPPILCSSRLNFTNSFVVNRNPDQPRIEMFKHELSVIIIQIGILSKKRDDYKYERCYIVVFLMECESFYSSNSFFLDFGNILNMYTIDF